MPRSNPGWRGGQLESREIRTDIPRMASGTRGGGGRSSSEEKESVGRAPPRKLERVDPKRKRHIFLLAVRDKPHDSKSLKSKGGGGGGKVREQKWRVI